MNFRRKFLQMVDLRVRQHLIHQRITASQRLGRVHSIESLASDETDFRAFGPVKKMAENPSI